ncbi:MAG TPA: 5-amino-6-(D-ribitylamino)uracil--L-tyrosine 4-hydroxyphenyl transferase CofH, partial [Candidatus Acidoferrales bacterium]|nr:5-amino-6-(D-ribitylamino)uracil--L-tyrosine 4-hydroxyphenyl transferase CofH [Candidatus Acidoferrales bacterium]
SSGDALALYEQAATPALLASARAVRDRAKGRTVSYSRKVFIPLTTLCRDYCGYCTFRKDPEEPGAHFMTPEEVLALAEAGGKAGCKEALFSLGDRPEAIFPEARAFLHGQGYARTLEYLAAMCEMVLERTGLLPHANPGLMPFDDLKRLKRSNASVGIMLENISPRLLHKGLAHWRAPDKVPALRLRTIEDAGRLGIPFTTGILIGIGETPAERFDSLAAIRTLHERYGHIQEVIVQNFRAKPGTRMAEHADAELEDLLRTLAVARLMLPASMNLQAPPNLSYSDFPRLLEAGINDWGGISPVTLDFINPEAAWPQIATLEAATRAAGLELRERLAIYPEFIEKQGCVDVRMAGPIGRLQDGQGYARLGESRMNGTMTGTTRLPSASTEIDAALRAAAPSVARILGSVLEGSELNLESARALCNAEGGDLSALVCVADELRHRQAGDAITYVVNRNINFTNVCTVGCSFCGFSRGPRASDAYFLTLDEVAAKAGDAAARGATEVCIQGGLPRDLDGWFYRDILRVIKRAVPEMHIHAFSPMEIANGVDRTGLPLGEYLAMLKSEGLGSIPGTAAEILDDEVRLKLSPNKLPVARWVEIIRAAHALGIPTTSTMMYGHVETVEHRLRHMLLLREIQKETGGFTEFVPLGFVHPNTRLYRDGEAQPGATRREHVVVHAVARLFLGAAIPNLQVSWVKMGFDASLDCLRAGANDFSGTLMEESISKSAGATFGEYVAPEEFRARIRSIGRVPAERTTTYGIRRTFSAEDGAERVIPRLRMAGEQDSHRPVVGY